MKRRWIFSVISILLLLAGCQKRGSIDEILNGLEGTPIEHIEVPVDDGLILIYTIRPTDKDFLAIGAGYLTGDKNDGWVKQGGFDWFSMENSNLMPADYRFTAYPNDPESKSIYVSYGFVPNPYIDQIFLKDRDNGKWTKATFDKEKRIYYKIRDNQGVKAVGKDGAIIDIQGTGAFDMQQLFKLQKQGRTFLREVEELRGYDYYFTGVKEYHMSDEEFDFFGMDPDQNLANVLKLEYSFPFTPEEFGSEKSTITLFVLKDLNIFGIIENNHTKQRLIPGA